MGGGWFQQIQLRTDDRENGYLGACGSPLVRGSGGSCNLTQEISFHIVKFSCSGGSTNSVVDRRQKERGSGGGSTLVRGSGGSCNLVQEISFHTVKFS